MIQIYHNSRCSKSRAALQYLHEHVAEYEVINYIKEGITADKVIELAEKNKVDVIDLIRKNEDAFKTEIKGNDFNDEELAQKISENPKLLQRPILVNGNKAVIARPTDRITEIL